MNGWMGVKAVLRIAYNNQKFVQDWFNLKKSGGRVGGMAIKAVSRFAYSNQKENKKFPFNKSAMLI